MVRNLVHRDPKMGIPVFALFEASDSNFRSEIYYIGTLNWEFQKFPVYEAPDSNFGSKILYIVTQKLESRYLPYLKVLFRIFGQNLVHRDLKMGISKIRPF